MVDSVILNIEVMVIIVYYRFSREWLWCCYKIVVVIMFSIYIMFIVVDIVLVYLCLCMMVGKREGWVVSVVSL